MRAGCRPRTQTMLWSKAPWLHQEVSHLPEKYRIPIVLCYFEGLTHDEAASGWAGRSARSRGGSPGPRPAAPAVDPPRRDAVRDRARLAPRASRGQGRRPGLSAAGDAQGRTGFGLPCRCVTGHGPGCFPTGVCFSRRSVTHHDSRIKLSRSHSPRSSSSARWPPGWSSAATQLSGGSANAGKASQVPAARPNQRGKDVAATRKAAQPASEGSRRNRCLRSLLSN